MSKNGALFAVCFVAGLLAAAASATFLWACNNWGVTGIIGVRMSQSLQLVQLYPKLFAGGLWGLLYFFTVGIPRHRRHWIRKGLWFSLIPSGYALFYQYPYVYGHGLAALNLGMLAPVLIIVANLVWGFFTGFFTRLLWGR
jgi:hypothetical protein